MSKTIKVGKKFVCVNVSINKAGKQSLVESMRVKLRWGKKLV